MSYSLHMNSNGPSRNTIKYAYIFILKVLRVRSPNQICEREILTDKHLNLLREEIKPS